MDRFPSFDKEPPLPGYAGIASFLRAPHVDFKGVTEDVDLAVLGIPFDGAVSNKPGARYGPAAIRRESGQLAYFSETADDSRLRNVDTDRTIRFGDLEIIDCGDVRVKPNDIDETRTRIKTAVQTIAESTFPLLLGGDHYLTYPGFSGVAATVAGPVGLLHVDAHSDTARESPLYGDDYHGSPMARIHDSKFGSSKRHAMIGIRGHERSGYEAAIEHSGAQSFTMRNIDEQGIEAVAEAAIEHASSGAEAVYLTVDIDAVDPAFAPGTGTPEPGGLTSRQLLRLMDSLGKSTKIAAMDLVEVAPNWDPAGITQTLACQAIVRFLEARFL